MAISGLILGLASNYGLPVLTKILQGDSVGAANTVIKAIASQLGVEPTEAAISAAEKADPQGFNEVMQTIETDFAAMAESAASATKSYHEILKADQQSEGLLARIWRPVNGMVFALECAVLVLSFVYCMVSGQVDVLVAASGAFGFLGTVLTAHAGVVGVYTWRRTTEKMN